MFIVPITSQLAPARVQPEQTGAAKSVTDGLPFADVLKEAMSEYRQAQEASQADARTLATGSVENLADVMINSLRLSTAIELTTQITSRAVSSYKEIMQMQV